MSEALAMAPERKPKVRPILFSGEMVRAILEGRKTQSRRPLKPQPSANRPEFYADRYNRSEQWAFWLPDNRMSEPRTWACPWGDVGDVLWVREALHRWPGSSSYAADGEPLEVQDWEWFDGYAQATCPSIHMPRWAARLWLRITDVRVQRLQEISEEDAKAEGVERDSRPFVYGFRNYGQQEFKAEHVSYFATARESFSSLWESIYGQLLPGCWVDNPWVWALTFERIERPANV